MFLLILLLLILLLPLMMLPFRLLVSSRDTGPSLSVRAPYSVLTCLRHISQLFTVGSPIFSAPMVNVAMRAQSVLRELNVLPGVKYVFSTPFHPQKHAVVERFHGTLKIMLRKLSHECPTCWDKYLDAALYAYRSQTSSATICLTAEYQTAFESVCSLLSSDPILVIPDMDSPFVVRTDASDFGVGAVLLQPRDDV
ncbi:integrase core domain [Plakobranchus ocellatus]|uniref:Integrase core domain n=1 Tax=Plakobranchus ocellatus TaxID=259542 RepID=A0AAV4BFY2_9GAST|nr:integrase core domain [Plakobranchus ocellatus]